MAKNRLRILIVVSIFISIFLQLGCDKKPQNVEKPVQKDEKTMAAQDKAMTKVRIETSKGNIVIELNEEKGSCNLQKFPPVCSGQIL